MGVSASGRHFADGRGNPVFWLGDTQWDLFRLFTPGNALSILRRRRAQGFNVILIMLTGVNMKKLGRKSEIPYANLDGETPWTGNDPLSPNEKYFRRVDDAIRLGGETGQTFVVGVYHQWHADMITVAKARGWARWVATRYRDVPGLIWCMYPKALPEFVPVCRELAAGLRDGDRGAHLISIHPDPSVTSSSFMHEEEWLAFNMIQTCVDYDKIHETVTADYRRDPVKPVIMAEGGYEGVEFDKLQTAHHIRKQAWWTHLAGGFHVYGHNDAWMHPHEWGKWLDSPGSGHMKVFQEIATSCDRWWDMVPDQTILASGAGAGYALNASARASSGKWILAYLSEPSTVTIRKGAIKSGARAKAWFIDPATGNRNPAGEFGADSEPSFTCPSGWEDAVLYLKAE